MIKNKKLFFISIVLIGIVLFIGSFYIISHKNIDSYTELMKGNFDVIDKLDAKELSSLQTIFSNQQERNDMEWTTYSLNSESNLFIWRYKKSDTENIRRIVAIILENKGECKLLLLDTVDNTEYYSFENNNLIYYAQSFVMYDTAFYFKCIINENFEIESEKEMQLLIMPSDEYIIGETDEDYLSSVKKQYSFLNGEGSYFIIRKYKNGVQEEEILTEEEWMAEFVSLTGFSLEQGNASLYELIRSGGRHFSGLPKDSERGKHFGNWKNNEKYPLYTDKDGNVRSFRVIMSIN